MRWRIGLLGCVAALAALFPAGAARGEPARVALQIAGVQQMGPAHPNRPIGLAVEVRNRGQAECGPCRLRVLGGGNAVTEPLPRIPPGQAAKVAVTGLVFPRAGKYTLSIVVDAPKELVVFTGSRPHTAFELTVLEEIPAGRRPAR